MNPYIIQTVGFIGFILLVVHFQINNRSKILILKMFASFAFALHFFLLGALTGSLMNLFAGFRSIVFKYRTTYKWANNKFWLFLFIGIFIFFGIISWEGIHSLFAMTGMIFGTIAYWSKNPKNIRIITLFGAGLWFMHNFIVKSYAGILTDSFVFISALIGIYRFDMKKEKVRIEDSQANPSTLE